MGTNILSETLFCQHEENERTRGDDGDDGRIDAIPEQGRARLVAPIHSQRSSSRSSSDATRSSSRGSSSRPPCSSRRPTCVSSCSSSCAQRWPFHRQLAANMAGG